ncbi:zinc ribbon domain-containing protein [Sphaerisporangium corydalis]|uniref:Zinc ribbon domain-containing protein n=1 Tax=Sphaerisporangium corydalis TaxID=1441875 RepID=A0ABV9E6G1_9ACTN|nr:zinc ribbon domain-containing protein [Sphaerisporangium corydalis]
MHPHPSGSTDRVLPGTVRVEAQAHVTINLLDDRGVIQQVVREYETPVGIGSGFNVSPDGVVVTATGVVQSGKDVSIYAANRVFAEYFKVKIPADFSRHKLKNPDLNGRLQACYPPQRQNSNCIVTAVTKVTVFPYADPPVPEGYPADLVHTGTSPSAPAVLKLAKGGEDSTLPTVPLGTGLGSGIESTDVVGLPVRPSAKTPPKVETAHLDPPGGRTFKPAERSKLSTFLSNDGDGAAVVDDGKSEVIGLVTGGGGAPETLTPVEDIRAALVAANLTARRGPVDVVYETALASYHNKFYANAIPVLEQVLRLRPDHAVAQDHLRFARANRAKGPSTQANAPAARKPAFVLSPLVLTAIGVVAVGVLIAIAVPLTLRRRRQAGEDGAEGDRTPERMAAAATWPPLGTQAMDAGPPAEGSFPAQRRAPGSGTGPSPVAVVPGSAAGVAGGNGTQVVFCTQCGMRLGKAHRFCGFCGHAVDQ